MSKGNNILDKCRRCGSLPVMKCERQSSKPKVYFWCECPVCGARSYGGGVKRKAGDSWNYNQRQQSAFPLTSRTA